jgi:hypothetical protein
MTWNELNALADELHQAYDRGAFQGLPLVLVGNPQVMRPELLAQITPADIDHVRTRSAPTFPTDPGTSVARICRNRYAGYSP